MSKEKRRKRRRGAGSRHRGFEEKRRLLEYYFDRGASVQEVARIGDVNPATVSNWLKRIDGDMANVERLRREARPPSAGSKRELDDGTKREILSLVERHPGMGPLKVRQYLLRHHQRLISARAIYYFLKSEGVVDARRRGKTRSGGARDRRFEFAAPMEAVQLDFMDFHLVGGLTVHLLSLLDDHSRYVLSARTVVAQTSETFLEMFRETVRRHGIMGVVICDRDPAFVSWNGFTKFEELLCSLDVELIASGPEKPWCQGKVERWHRTLREEFEKPFGPFDSAVVLRVELEKFLAYYNHERPHQGIGGLTPADRFFGLRDQLEAALGGAGVRNGSEKVYFSCNIGGRKLVVVGPSSGELEVYRDNEKIEIEPSDGEEVPSPWT